MDNYYKRKRNIRDIAINITNLCKQQVIGQQKIQGLLGDVVSMLDESLESSNLFSIANKDTEDAIFQPKNIIICLVMRKTANSLETKLKIVLKHNSFLYKNLFFIKLQYKKILQ